LARKAAKGRSGLARRILRQAEAWLDEGDVDLEDAGIRDPGFDSTLIELADDLMELLGNQLRKWGRSSPGTTQPENASGIEESSSIPLRRGKRRSGQWPRTASWERSASRRRCSGSTMRPAQTRHMSI